MRKVCTYAILPAMYAPVAPEGARADEVLLEATELVAFVSGSGDEGIIASGDVADPADLTLAVRLMMERGYVVVAYQWWDSDLERNVMVLGRGE